MDRAGILSLARLMQFGDSMLPTGAFAFSGALEAAVQKGAVHDVPTLQQYVVSALRQSSTGDAVGLDRALRRLCADPVSMGGPVSDAALARLRTIDLALYRRKLPEEFRDMMTRTGRKLAELAAAIIRALDRMYAAFPADKDRWLAQYRADCLTPGNPVRLITPAASRDAYATGIDEEFRLLVEYPDGTTSAVSTGEVSVRGLYGYV